MEEDPRRSTVPTILCFLDTGADFCALRPASHSPQYRQLILPYLQLDIKYFDLGLEHRDAVRRSAPIFVPPY